MPDIALRLEGVSQVFHQGTPSEVRALDRVNLELERGTFTVVLGANGSGKSSLLNAIAGGLTPAAGQGLPRRPRKSPAGRNSGGPACISRVFQNPFTGTAADLSIAENLALASRRGSRRWLGRALGRIGGGRCENRSASWGWASRNVSTRPSVCSRGASARRSPC